MDSVFFVCDNSMTGHICNDICKFIPKLLRQMNKSLTAANGTGPCLQEGTVCFQSLYDDGMKHTFILDNCLFNPVQTHLCIYSPQEDLQKYLLMPTEILTSKLELNPNFSLMC
jgi:hypothetical protein